MKVWGRMPADNRLCIVIPFYSVISIEKRQWRCVTVAMGLRVVSFRFCYCIRHRRIGSFFLCRPPQKTRGQTPSMIGKDGKGVPEEWQSILVTFTFKLLFFFLASSAELKCRLFVQQETSLTPSAAAAAVKEGKPRRRRLWNEKLRWH